MKVRPILITATIAALQALSFHSANAADEARFQGAAQFWIKPPTGSFPQPLAAKTDLEMQVALPSANQPATRAERVLTAPHGLTAKLQVYLRFAEAPGAPAYAIIQVRVLKNSVSLAECNSYHSLADATPFPVAVCSGFLASGDQVGVSLMRPETPLERRRSSRH